MWQFHHMHTLHFEVTNDREILCPACGEIYQNRKTMPKNVTLSAAEPKSPKSVLVMLALGFICLAFVVASASVLLALPLLSTFAILDGLAAVTFAVLSLRETA